MNRQLYIIIVLIFLFGTLARAVEDPILAITPGYYYGSIDSHGQDLKQELHQILNRSHISQDDGADRIVSQCDTFDIHCYKHKNLGYKKARQYLFGFLHLEGNEEDGYSVRTAYCLKRMTNDDFATGKGIGPMKIPNSNVLNTEHTWPQSRFTNRFSKSMQKSDLHGLFPLISNVNSNRGNQPFGEVDTVIKQLCPQAALGSNEESSQRQFEPAQSMKGNIARALFYFSPRY
ncbi:MAG: endonuclease, partial [Bdellovibrionales bacterium]|nr:endonuclease [Bdellovibrionales bacterium]NQZ18751.1 endonuclease [Bdellovibrionales bacterium]